MAATAEVVAVGHRRVQRQEGILAVAVQGPSAEVMPEFPRAEVQGAYRVVTREIFSALAVATESHKVVVADLSREVTTGPFNVAEAYFAVARVAGIMVEEDLGVMADHIIAVDSVVLTDRTTTITDHFLVSV